VKVTAVELLGTPAPVARTVAVLTCPVGALQDSTEVPLDPGILVAVNEQDAVPVAETESVTVPVKPPRGATVTVEVPDTVASVVTLVGLALRLIPGEISDAILTVITVELDITLLVPPVPVIVTV
jgi:hypothetical protein